MGSALMELRAALGTTTNTTGVLGSAAGGAAVQKEIQAVAVEAFNSKTDIAKLLRRRNINQLAYIWNLVTATSDLANTSFAFYTEGEGGTPAVPVKVQLYAIAKGYRTDYEVTGLMIAAGMGDQLQYEMGYAAESLAIGEERSIICGTDTSAYGFANSFLGLLQLMGSYATFAETTNVYGIARASGKTYLDVNVVLGGATSAAALALTDLDAAITASNKKGGKGHKRIFFCSEDRVDEIAHLLQSQQRFNNTTEVAAGFRVLSYRQVPIVGSRFMDKNGITWDGSTKTASHADQAMYLLDLDHIFMVHVAGINAVHVPVVGADAHNRYDVQGGYFKSYGVLVMDRFDTQTLIANLTDI